MDDSIYALDIHKAHHGVGPPSYLDEAALDHVAGAQFTPQVLGKVLAVSRGRMMCDTGTQAAMVVLSR